MSGEDNVIGSYGKVYNLGRAEVANVFDGPVTVQEKVDGSQFGFLRLGDRLHCRSRGRHLPENPDDVDNQFRAAVEALHERLDTIPEGVVFRGECLTRPRHNVLAYDRTPRGCVILFDAHMAETGEHASEDELRRMASRMGLEVVPSFSVDVNNREAFDALLETTSHLGGQKVEGLVFKNYAIPDPTGHGILKAKYVAERFREIAGSKGKRSKRPGETMLDQLAERYTTDARYHKAVQHLRDAGTLTDSPADIGPLMAELSRDLLEECGDEIREAVWKWAWKTISKRVSSGLPSWYKEQLVRRQFGEEAAE